MLILFTDYGASDPYVGQIKAVLHRDAPGIAVIDLLHTVPSYNAHAGAHLLAALAKSFPVGSVFLCVIDPGVGGDRAALVVEADGRYYVGPDNGLLSVIAQRAGQCRVWAIDWRPDTLSDTFHGRDVFAPVAARLATTGLPVEWLSEAGLAVSFDMADLPRVIYIDHYGNAWTGVRGGLLDRDAKLRLRDRELVYRRTFVDTEKGQPFWYVNSVGLIEIAANRSSATELLGLAIGDMVRLSGSPDSRLH